MISNQVLQSSIEELKSITRIDLAIIDLNGQFVASTYESDDNISELISAFLDSQANSQAMKQQHFFKVFYEDEPEYILISKGVSDDAYMIGRIAVSEIQNLLVAYKNKYDKHNFIQNLIMDNLLLVDIHNRAAKLHIQSTARRTVFIIETPHGKCNEAIETVKNIFQSGEDFVTTIDEDNIILVKQLESPHNEKEITEVSNTLLDMINSEVMIKVRVASGTVVNDLSELSNSYKEAKMALDVGRIFYPERNSITYSSLGIGRLIYQIPVSLCKMFIHEIFGDVLPDVFDEETLSTINKFFNNNLNVSETARQLYVHRNTLVYRLEKIQKSTGLDIRSFEDAMTFKIALMVLSLMNHLEVE